MKNKSLHTAIAYWFLAMALVLFLSGCRTKKSTTDLKETKNEKVSVTDNSTAEKKETVKEVNQENKSETFADKSFFEAWMSFESDKITITDKNGTVTEISKPKINKKSSQANDIDKSDVVVAKNEITTTNEEKQQSNINANLSKETEADLQQKTSSKGKEPVWLYVVGAVVVGGFGYLILKRFKLI